MDLRFPSAAAGAQRCHVIQAASVRQRGLRLCVRSAVGDPEPKTTQPKPSVPATAPSKEAALRRPEEAPQAALSWPARRPWSAVAWDRAVDTADDVFAHVKRAFQELPTTLALTRHAAGGGVRLQAAKPVVLVLGSGWGAHSLIKVIDCDAFQPVVVSPRNFFLFTPMLPSTAVGTVEFRSLLEPIRIANPFCRYFEASCERVDLERRVAFCTSAVAYEGGRRPSFEVPFDVLVVAVGEQPATFGVPGVAEHCFFMKEITDCTRLRPRIQGAFELAALPGTPEADIRKALHFVVVGGGPTGVEFAGTLCDFLKQDLRAKYPELMQYVRVTLLQSQQSILTQFDVKLQRRAIDGFARAGVELRTGVRVVEVTQDDIVLKGGERLPFGVCVWSTGNAPRLLVQSIVSQLPEQVRLVGPLRGVRCSDGIIQTLHPTVRLLAVVQAAFNPNPAAAKLAVDPFLRVIGARDVIALGDCSALVGAPLPATAQVAGQQGAYAAHLVNRGYLLGPGGLGQSPPAKPAEALTWTDRVFGTLDDGPADSGDDASAGMVSYKRPFEFLSLGIMAYVGGNAAVVESDVADLDVQLSGSFAFLLWRSVYITKQVSLRNRVLILFDWLKARVFGRDLSQF